MDRPQPAAWQRGYACLTGGVGPRPVGERGPEVLYRLYVRARPGRGYFQVVGEVQADATWTPTGGEGADGVGVIDAATDELMFWMPIGPLADGYSVTLSAGREPPTDVYIMTVMTHRRRTSHS